MFGRMICSFLLNITATLYKGGIIVEEKIQKSPQAIEMLKKLKKKIGRNF